MASSGLWLARTVIYADSSADTTGPCLLYKAIGAGNPRVYVPGRMMWATRPSRTTRREDNPSA